MNVQSLVYIPCLVLMPAATTARSQTAQTQHRVGQHVRSPEVLSEGRVTFLFHAPNAKNQGTR